MSLRVITVLRGAVLGLAFTASAALAQARAGTVKRRWRTMLLRKLDRLDASYRD